MEDLSKSKQKVVETLSKLITGLGEGKITVASIHGDIPDILATFEKIEDGTYFLEKAKESVSQINLLLEAKSGLYELLDYYMEHVADYTYNQTGDRIELVVSKFTQIKPKIVTKDHVGEKILYVASKPVRKGNIDEFTSYMGDDEFVFTKYSHDVDQVITLNHVHDLSFGNYFVIINGDTYPAFYALDDIAGKIKPFYAGSGVIFNIMNT
ncbi:hypothetical protein XbC2_134 [Xanthomonas phage XbC2]|nr:hypothetical protein XbC2_134 [Xanthomonas phage XbC2]